MSWTRHRPAQEHSFHRILTGLSSKISRQETQLLQWQRLACLGLTKQLSRLTDDNHSILRIPYKSQSRHTKHEETQPPAVHLFSIPSYVRRHWAADPTQDLTEVWRETGAATRPTLWSVSPLYSYSHPLVDCGNGMAVMADSAIASRALVSERLMRGANVDCQRHPTQPVFVMVHHGVICTSSKPMRLQECPSNWLSASSENHVKSLDIQSGVAVAKRTWTQMTVLLLVNTIYW